MNDVTRRIAEISTRIRPAIKDWYAYTHEYPSLAGNTMVATSFARMRELCVQIDGSLRDCERLAAQLTSDNYPVQPAVLEQLQHLSAQQARFVALSAATNQRVMHAIRQAPPGVFRRATPEEIMRRRAAGM